MALITGDGNDNDLVGTDGDDVILGLDGNDKIHGAKGNDILRGGNGDDLIFGGAGDDEIHGGFGNDTVSFESTLGAETVDLTLGTAAGHAGNDTLDGIENVTASAYDDTVSGDQYDNIIIGLAGMDTIGGGAGNDTLYGGDDNDKVNGGKGDDLIYAGSGDDEVHGAKGADIIDGGSGADILKGGAESDTFVYKDVSDSALTSRDTIMDFKEGVDHIDLTLIDADTTTDGDQAFHQVGAFTGAAGELVMSYDSGTNRTTVSFDINGDGVADMAFLMKGEHTETTDWML